MEREVVVTPTLIYRWVADRLPGFVDLPHPDHDENALLIFMDPEQAEGFRSETGDYPADEGFEVRAVDLDAVRAVVNLGEYGYVALRGPEEDTVSFFKAGDFFDILEASGQ